MLFFEAIIIKFSFWLFFKTKAKFHSPDNKPRLFWGTVPLLSFKYWNEALKKSGYFSQSLMFEHYHINKKTDFDLYFYDIISPLYLRPFIYLRKKFPHVSKLHWIFYIAKNFDILHITFEGVVFKGSDMWDKELAFYKKLGLKIIALPYGGDYQMYSKLYNKSWHHAMLVNYPEGVQKEKMIRAKIEFLTQNADCIMSGFQFDHVSRWDILPYAIYPIDCDLWKPKTKYNEANGINGVVKIYHTPNHKTIKGTEFIIKAIDELKAEGLLIELILLENIQNDQVRILLFEDADILIEQLILGYALSALEGMATGLPVISNLEEENETRLFRRFSYLNECPILSSNPEKIKQSIKTLVTNPELRKQLGEAGVMYTQKYHSFPAMVEIFTAIYEKVWYKKEADLMGFFDPNNPNSFNNKNPLVKHPLIENRYVL